MPTPVAVAASTALTLAFTAAAPAVAGPSLGRRVAAAATCAVALALPWTVPTGYVFLRALLTLLALVAAFRVVDLGRDTRSWPLRVRWAMTFGFVDAREAIAVRPGVASRDVSRALAWGVALAASTWAGAYGLAAPRDVAELALRWALGLLAFYAAAETVLAVVRLGYRAAGYDPGVTHRTPALASSVGAFWSERWNLTVSRWLARHTFRPLARRRRPRLGIALGFLASAGAHAYFALVPLGAAMATAMGAFFVLHGALVLLERPLGVRRWPAPAGRVWTWGAFLLTSPLFIEPTLRILGDRRAGPDWAAILPGG